MAIMREQFVKIARESLERADPTSHDANPATYDPPEFVLEAMQRAYSKGFEDGVKVESERPF